MKILLTGGAGYIGSMLTNDLLKENYTVTVLDNFMYGQASLNHLCHYENSTLSRVMLDFSRIQALLKEHDVIIPLLL